MKKTIFVVDDNDMNLVVAEEALSDQYRVLTLPSADKMFKLLEKIMPDLILLDIDMPVMDGFQTLQKLQTIDSCAEIPVIFLTGMTDSAVEARVFELGAVDFISKPFSAPVLRNRIRTHLNIESLIRERTEKLEQLRNGLIYIIADLVESRDVSTGGHIERTAGYIRIMVNAIVSRGLYAEEMQDLDTEALVSSARLHDLGKIAIPDAVLNKLGSLTLEEFELMKTHTVVGEAVIDKILSRVGDDTFLRNAKLFASTHHERWDGTGYPRGLKGLEIPIQGRILAIVDVFDALTSDRQYKRKQTEDDVIEIIRSNRGKLFDPLLVDAFLDVIEDIRSARKDYGVG